MRIKFFNNYIILAASLLSAGCADEHVEFLDEEAPLSIMITSSWQDGRAGNDTRALPDFLSGTITTPTPAWICINVPGKEMFYVKNDSKETPDTSKEPDGYKPYHKFFSMEDEELRKCPISRGDARRGGMVAYYLLDKGVAAEQPSAELPSLFTSIPAIGACDYMSSDATGYPVNENYRDHLLFTLKHRTALLRLKFVVSNKYLQIRDIVLRKVTINDQTLLLGNDANVGGTSENPLPGMKLSGSATPYACAYIRTTGDGGITTSSELTFKCTYDIYDKDDISAAHLTRKGVTATNKVVLNTLSTPINTLEAGKYYDLTITINPDYLYVLSEHDNKHITIN